MFYYKNIIDYKKKSYLKKLKYNCSQWEDVSHPSTTVYTQV